MTINSTTFSFRRTERVSLPAACDLAMATGACLWLMLPSQAMAQSTQGYFGGPEQSGQALVDAVRNGDNAIVAVIVGTPVIERRS